MKRISVYDVKPGLVIARPVYGRDGRRLLLTGVQLTDQYINRLRDLGVPTIYIQEPDPLAELDQAKLYENVKELPDAISFETRLEAEKRLCILMNEAKRGQLFDVKPVHGIVDTIIEQTMTNKNIIGKLTDIRILDDYTFAHCVNVCVLSVAIGINLGYPRRKLHELAVGALLHDLGKVTVSEDILQKPAALTTQEFEIVKQHSKHGYDMLRLVPGVSVLAANIALQHHERYNGEGYPRSVKGEAIHEFARIVAIADVYDALTADRVYKNMVLPYEAVEIIIASAGYQFDPELVRVFVENTAIYPIGSLVQLNSGATGVIIKNNRTLPMRPTVRLVTSPRGEDVQDIELDLMTNTTTFVTRVISFKNVNVVI